MKNSNSIKYLLTAFFVTLLVAILPSCKDEEPVPRPFAHFSAEASATNILEYSFTNLSNHSTSYVWDFGDGGSSTEENPTHTFASFGIFSVTLTASNADGESAIGTHEIEITEPEVELAIIAGEESKKWIIQREGVALGIYAPDGGAWWEFGGNALGERPCVLDDEITFFRDGTVQVDTKNTVYLDSESDGGWNDNLGAGCHDESEAGLWTAADGSDVSDFANGGSYTFEYDKDAKVLTANGSGFYIGLTSKTNTGDQAKPITSKTYNVTKLVEGDGVDTLQLIMDMGDGGKWIFNLVSYDDFSMAPDVPVADPPPAEKPLEENDLYDLFTGADNSSNISWMTDEVTLFTLGVDNPDANETFKCAEYKKGGGDTENIQCELDYRIDFSTRNQFSIKAYFPSSNDYADVDPEPAGWGSSTLQKTIVLRFYDSTHGAPWESQAQIVYDVVDLDKWIDITYDLSDIADNTTYDKVIIQIGGEGHDRNGTFYISDLKLNQ